MASLASVAKLPFSAAQDGISIPSPSYRGRWARTTGSSRATWRWKCPSLRRSIERKAAAMTEQEKHGRSTRWWSASTPL
ncbi:MAG: hypothetical protein ACLRI7_06620 [Ruthenibacterium lactatiformans]